MAADRIEDAVNDATQIVGGTEGKGLISLDDSQRYSDICEDMRQLALDEKKRVDFEFYCYYVTGIPLVLMSTYCPKFPRLNDGRMSILPKPGLWVEGTVGSPYASGSGILMKEFAVNLSQSKGYNGRVGCAAASAEAEKTWCQMGFRKTGKKYTEKSGGKEHEYPVLFLDPVEIPQYWALMNGRWSFKPKPFTLSGPPHQDSPPQ